LRKPGGAPAGGSIPRKGSHSGKSTEGYGIKADERDARGRLKETYYRTHS